MRVFVTVVESAGSLCYVWAQSDFTAYEDVEELISKFNGSADPNFAGKEITDGEVVLARYEDQWYRAQTVEGRKCFFMDFGNTEEVPTSDVVLAASSYFVTPPLAVKYILADITAANGHQWTRGELDSLQETLQNGEFEAEIVSPGSAGVVPTVRLVASGTNVCQELVARGCGKPYNNDHVRFRCIPDSLLPAGSNHVYVQYSASALKFWIQLASSEQISAELGEHLEEYISSGARRLRENDIKTCMPCVASYEEIPYRAVISTVNTDRGTCDVYFTDYGNTEEVSFNEVMELPNNLATTPALVSECSLSGEAVRTTNFSRIIESEEIYATVRHRLDSGLYIVSLSENKRDAVQVNTRQSQPAATKPTPLMSKYTPIQFNLGAAHDVCISHVSETGRFFCQLIGNAQKLDDLMTSLQHASARPMLPQTTKEESPCLVSKDNLLYRGKIVSKKGGGAMVHFVDFGNAELVAEEDLYNIEPEFMQLPAQAICCHLDGAESWPVTAIVQLLNRFNSSKALVGKVVLKTVKYYDIELRDEKGANILGLVHKGVKPSAGGDLSVAAQSSVSPAEVTVGTEEAIYVTVLLSNTEFFGQLGKYSMDTLEAFQEQLRQYYSVSKPPLPRARVGDLCVTVFSEDEAYYRARILETDGTRCHVSLVDYGNEEVKTLRELYMLEPQFCALPVQGITCCLADSYSGVPDALMESFVDSTLVVRLVKRQADGYIVEVPDVRENSTIYTHLDKYKKKPKANMQDYRELELATGHVVECEVSHVEDPGRFFCQPLASQPSLHELMDEVDGYCGATPPISTQSAAGKHILGNPVLAKYSADGGWYRAVVTGFIKNGNKVEVFFVDYGNMDRVSEYDLRPIQQNFLKLEAQAIKCSLDGIGDTTELWPQPLSDKFSGMVQESIKLHIGKYNARDEQYNVEVETADGIINESFLRSANRLRAGYRSSGRIPDRSESSCRTPQPKQSNIEQRLMRSPSSVAFQSLDIALNRHLSMSVVYAESPSRFWCQLASHQQEFEQLRAELNDVYNRLGDTERPMLNLIENRVCCAQYSEDEQWYRAKVVSASGGMVQVQFVDYGNTEKVKPWKVKELSPEFFNLPAQAFQCTLFNLEPVGPSWSEEAKEKFEDLTIEECVLGLALDEKNGQYVVELIAKNSQSVEDVLVSSGHAKLRTTSETPMRAAASRKLSVESGSTSSSRVSAQAVKFTEGGFSKGDLPEVYVSYIVSPDDFYVQQASSGEDLNDLTESIQQLYSKLGAADMPLRKAEVGMACCAQFDEDEQWYRGQIKAVERGRVHVRFVDWGNDAWVTLDKLKQLKKPLSTLPTQAVRCKLDGVSPVGGQWSRAAVECFEAATLDKLLLAEVKSEGEIHAIQLVTDSDDEINMGSLLARNGYAKFMSPSQTPAAFKGLDLRMRHMYDVGISWVVNLQEFYCQLAEHAPQLCALSEKLSQHFEQLRLSDQALTNPKPGDVCVSYYPADGNWYRGVVLATTANVAKVQYIDYGNSETVPQSKLKQLSSDFQYQPRFSFQCSLKLDNPSVQWDRKVISVFESLTRQQLKCSIDSRQGDLCIVDLYDENGQKVSDLVLGKVGTHNRPERNERPGNVRYGNQERNFSDRSSDAGSDGTRSSGFGSKGGWEERRGGFDRNDRNNTRRGRSEGRGGGYAGNNQEGGREFGRRGERGVGFGESEERNRGFGRREDRGGDFRGKQDNDDRNRGFGRREDRGGGFRETREGEERNRGFEKRGERGGGFGEKRGFGSSESRGGFRDTRSENSWDSASASKSGGFGRRDDGGGGFGRRDDGGGGFGRRDEGSKTSGFGNRDERGNRFGDNKRSGGFGGGGRDDRNSLDGSDRSSGFAGNRREGGFVKKDNRGGFGSSENKESGFREKRSGGFGGGGGGGGFGGQAANAAAEESWDDISVATAVPSQPPPAVQAMPAAKSLPLPNLTMFSSPETNTAYVSIVHSPVRFFIQLAHKEDEIAELADKLTAEYSALFAGDRSVSSVEVGQLCCAKYAEDDAWYRAQIETVTASEIKVLFVDYGNLETVPQSDIRTLTDTYTSTPPLALECSLEGVRSFTDEDTSKLLELTEEGSKAFRVQLKSQTRPFKCVLVDPEDEHTSLAMLLPCWTSQPPQRAYAKFSVPTGPVGGYTSHIESPASFWIQLQSQEDALNAVMEKAAEEAGVKNALDNPQLNDPCLAQFSEDNEWYRAVVTRLEDRARVKFIDYGNDEVVAEDELKEISDDLVNIAPFAIECSLDNIPLDGLECPPNVLNFFKESTLDKELEITFMSDSKVELKEGDADINMAVRTMLLTPEEPTAAVPSAAPLKSQTRKLPEFDMSVFSTDHSAVVCVVHSPVQFFVHVKGVNTSELTDKITAEYSSLDPNERAVRKVDVGELCCVKIGGEDEDEPERDEGAVWSRAAVKAVDGTNVKVLLVDEGVFMTVPLWNVCALDDKYTTSPPLVLECSLYGVRTHSEEDTTTFKELTGFGAKVLNLEAKSDTLPMKCVLRDPQNEGSSLAEQLPSWASQPVLREYPEFPTPPEEIVAYISQCSNPSSFFVQLQQQEDDLNALMASIAEMSAEAKLLSDPQVTDPCLAQFSDDGEWYRAMVMKVDGDKAEMRFIDYGNGENVEKNSLKMLSDELLSTPPFSVECCLDGVSRPNAGYSDAVVEAFQEVTLEKELKLTFCSGTRPCAVKMAEGNTDINSAISSMMDGYTDSEATPPSYPACPKLEGKHQAFVSHVESPDEIYIQLLSNEAARNEIEDTLDKVYGEGSVIELQDPVVGMPCCAKCNEDLVWYRSRVTSVDEEKIGVFFIDYGNHDVVDKSNVRVLEPQFLEHCPSCYRAKLASVHAGAEVWPQDVKDRLHELTANKVLSVEIKSGAEPYDVILYFKEQNINDAITKMLEVRSRVEEPESKLADVPTSDVSGGMPRTDSQDSFLSAQEDTESSVSTPKVAAHGLAVGDKETVYVAHHISPSQFWVQQTSRENALTELSDNLQGVCGDGGEAVGTAADGDLCAAKFTDDSWYRARVSGEPVDGQADVYFVDFGNSHTVPVAELLKLPSAYSQPPAFAFECVLNGVRSKDGEWCESVKEHFGELTADESLSMEVVQVHTCASDVKSYTVNLNRGDGGSISDCLLELAGVERSASQLEPHPSPSRRSEASSDDFEPALESQSQDLDTVEERLDMESEYKAESEQSVHAETAVVEVEREAESIADDIAVCAKNIDAVERDVGQNDEISQESRQGIGDSNECRETEEAGGKEESKSTDESAEGVLNELVTTASEESTNQSGGEAPRVLPKAAVKLGIKVDVEVVHVVSPSTFWVKADDVVASADVDRLCELLQDDAEVVRGEALVGVCEGQVLAAQSGIDSLWYRARVTGISAETVMVQYVDYGNSEELPRTALRRLPTMYYAQPALVFQCCCGDLKPLPGQDWCDDAADLFNDITLGRALLADIQDVDESGVYTVKLLDMGIPVANRMIAESLAVGADGRCELTLEPSLLDETAFGIMQPKQDIDPTSQELSATSSETAAENAAFLDSTATETFLTNEQVTVEAGHMGEFENVQQSQSDAGLDTAPSVSMNTGESTDGEVSHESEINEKCQQEVESERQEMQATKEIEDYEEEDQEKSGIDSESAQEDQGKSGIDSESAQEDQEKSGFDSGSAQEDQEKSGIDSESAQEDQEKSGIDSESAQEDQGKSGIDSESAQEDQEKSGIDSESAQEDQEKSGIDSESAQEDQGKSGIDTESAQEEKGKSSIDSESAQEDQEKSGIDSESAQEDQEKSGIDSESAQEDQGKPGIDSESAQEEKGKSGIDSESAQEDQGKSGIDSESAQEDQGKSGINIESAKKDQDYAAEDNECGRRCEEKTIEDGKNVQEVQERAVENNVRAECERDAVESEDKKGAEGQESGRNVEEREAENAPDVSSQEGRPEEANENESGDSSGPRFTVCDVKEDDVLEVYVTNVRSPNEFYCQLAAAVTELPLFSDKLVDYCSNHCKLKTDVGVGDACAVLSDVSWCRARVTAVADDSVDVFYVDYGDSAVVPRSEVWEIEDEFLAWPVQVLRCSLAGVEPVMEGAAAGVWDDESQARLRELFQDAHGRDSKLFTATVERVVRGSRGELLSVEVSMRDGEELISEQLVEGGYAKRSGEGKIYSAWSPEDGLETAGWADTRLETLREESDNAASDGEDRDLDLNEFVGNLVMETIVSGHRKFMSERASTSLMEETLTFGVEDSVTATCLHVQSPSDFTLKLTDGSAARCSLAGVVPMKGTDWSPAACQALRDLIEDLTLHVNIVRRRTTGEHEVYVYDVSDEAHISINSLLVHRGHARSTELSEWQEETNQEDTFLDVSEMRSDSLGSLDESGSVTSTDGEAYGHVMLEAGQRLDVVFVKCTDDALVCQPAANFGALQRLLDDISDKYTDEEAPCLENPQIGQPCMVKSLDNRWQRCVVLGSDENTVQLLAVDDGGESFETRLENVRLLHQEFLQLPAQGVTIRLHGCTGFADNRNNIYDLLEASHCGIDGRVHLSASVRAVHAGNSVTAVVHTSSEGNLLDELLQNELVRTQSVHPSDPDKISETNPMWKRCTSLPETEIAAGECHAVVLTQADNPHYMWCQLQTDRLAILQSLQDCYGSEDCRPDARMSHGDVCVVESDGHWYRGKITSEFEGVYLVLCVDYGMTITTSVVYPLVEEFGTVGPQAVLCSLIGVQPTSGNEWSENSEHILSCFIREEFLMHISEVQHKGDLNLLLHIHLHSKDTDQSLRQRLIAEKLVKAADFE